MSETCNPVNPYQIITAVAVNVVGDAAAAASPARIATDLRQVEQQQGAFKERYAIRSAIESTNNEITNAQGLADLRVRGKPQASLAAMLKAAALNVKRAVMYHVGLLLQPPGDLALAPPANGAPLKTPPSNDSDAEGGDTRGELGDSFFRVGLFITGIGLAQLIPGIFLVRDGRSDDARCTVAGGAGVDFLMLDV